MKSPLAIFKFLNKFVDFYHKREMFKVKVNRMMKSFSSSLGSQYAAFLVILFTTILFMMASSSLGLRPHQVSMQAEGDIGGNDNSPAIDPYKERAKNQALGMEMYPTGSSLPDCSHACGPCFPCKRVIASFKCSVEYCPIVYRCMCKGKYYHVPSN